MLILAPVESQSSDVRLQLHQAPPPPPAPTELCLMIRQSSVILSILRDKLTGAEYRNIHVNYRLTTTTQLQETQHNVIIDH